jgi:hypothetical protein
LYYEYQRWYDPSIGRFISQDPFAGHLSNPQTLNPYVYVVDSPTSLTDPSGLSPWYVDLLESLGPENDILNIAQHLTGVNTDQLVGDTYGPQAQQIFTGSRMLAGGAFLANGIVAGAGIVVEPAIYGAAGSTVVTTGISGCTIEEGACQAGADAIVKDLSDVGASGGTEASSPGLENAEGGLRYPAQSLGRPGLVQYGPGPSEPGWSSAYATSGDYSTSAEARAGLSLHGGNPATWVRDVVAPEGSPMQVSQVRALWGQPGGGIQYEVADPSVWIVGPWRPLINIPIATIEMV